MGGREATEIGDRRSEVGGRKSEGKTLNAQRRTPNIEWPLAVDIFSDL
jgi:hypothetical protein